MSKKNPALEDIDLRKIIKEQRGIDAELIEPDGKFRFECKRCGECCRNRRDVVFSPFDVYQGAKMLNMACRDFMDEYTLPTVGGNSKIPIVTNRPLRDGTCSLLEYDVPEGKYRCSIHGAAPNTCQSFPLGYLDMPEADETVYIIVDGLCRRGQDTEKEQTAHEWMRYSTEHAEELRAAHRLQAPYADAFSFRDHTAVTEALFIANHLGLLKGDGAWARCATAELLRSLMTDEVHSKCYGSLDISRPFIPQAEEILAGLKPLFDLGCSAYSDAKSLLTESLGMDEIPDGEPAADAIRENLSGILREYVESGRHGSERQVLERINRQKLKIMKQFHGIGAALTAGSAE